MKIFVCIKQVPDTETKIKIAADNSSVDTSSVKWIMNPYDEYAFEEAIKIKEATPGAQIFVITVCPKKRANELLITALAMGADEGIVIYSPENLDPLTTAKALSQTIKGEGGADLIFTGKLAIDDNACSVGQMVAEFLNIPHTNVVSKLTHSAEKLICEREIEGGSREIVQMQKPALVGANKGLNKPRYASLPGIMKAKKKVLKTIEFSSLGLYEASKVKTLELSLPPEKPPVKLMTGDLSVQVSNLVTALRDEAKVL